MTAKHHSKSNGTPQKPKPHVLACAPPVTGHVMPILNISAQLIQRGYAVTMMTGAEFQHQIENIGATFFAIPPFDMITFKKGRDAQPNWSKTVAYATTVICVDPIPSQTKAMYAALEQIRDLHPDREVVIMTESFFMGHPALYYGAPLPRGYTRRPRSLNIHAMPYIIESRDMAPVGWGLMADKTDEGRRYQSILWENMYNETYPKVMALMQAAFREQGAVNVEQNLPYNIICTSADMTLHLCPPSLEYDITDLHPKVRFAGAISGRGPGKNFQYPSFWPDVTRGDKKLVVVTQGTVATDYSNLIIPTLRELADYPELLVVAILGERGAALPAEVAVPQNAHVIDYLNYNAILPHASAFVTNGGYGGFIQSMLHGVPMVLAGISEDKAEVAARGEYSGIAINLRTEKPDPGQISRAVERILYHGGFKRRVMEIRQENEDMKTMDLIENTILQLAGKA